MLFYIVLTLFLFNMSLKEYVAMNETLSGTVVVSFFYVVLSSYYIIVNSQYLKSNSHLLNCVLCWLFFLPIVFLTTFLQENVLLESVARVLNFLQWELAFLFFFIASQKEKKDIYVFFFILLAYALSVYIFIQLYYYNQEIVSSDALEKGIRRGVIQSYFLLCMIPFFLYFLYDKKIMYLFWGTTGYLLILSMKRTGFMAFLMSFVIFLYTKTKKIKYHFIIHFFLIVLAILLGYRYSNDIDKYSNNVVDAFMNRFEESSISSSENVRSDYRRLAWYFFLDTPIHRKILGYGYDGYTAYGLTHNSTHNDFLEILINYGLVYFALFLWLIVCLTSFFLYHPSQRDKCIMLISIVILFVISIFSHLLTRPEGFLFLSAYWGYSLGKQNATPLTESQNQALLASPNTSTI